MTDCIKTGAYVYIDPYSAYSPADIYALGDDYRILRFNPKHTWQFEPARELTHKVIFPDKEKQFYWSTDHLVLAVPTHYLIRMDQ